MVRSTIAFVLTIGIAAVANIPVIADEPTLSDAEKDAGFELLFNGRDLSGWQEVQGKAGTFQVREGILTGLRRDRSAYWLSTVHEYADFELRLQFKIPPKGNSGVFIRAPHDGRTSQQGMEIQIYDEPGKEAPDSGSMGAIYKVVPPRKLVQCPAGEWNDLWILCDGDRVKVTVNGEVVNDARMSEHEALKGRPRQGYLGLSAHTDTVEFRNIRLHTIKSQ